jgi:PAS domain-containing protein
MIEILKSKKPGGIGEVQTNLTEHQESMQALRESEDKYRMLVEKSLDAVALVKGERLVFINKVAHN